jgi:hypothetical protein
MAARKAQKTTRTSAKKTTTKPRGQKKTAHNAKPSARAAHAAQARAHENPAAKFIEAVGDTLSHIGEKALDGGRRVQAVIDGSSPEE